MDIIRAIEQQQIKQDLPEFHVGDNVKVHYRITEGTSLTPFFQMALRCDFDCYIAEQLIPMWRARYDGGTELF